jgi:hypothetical protein
MLASDLFKPRRQVELENLFLRHQLNVAVCGCGGRPGVVGMDVTALAKPASVGQDRST